MEPNSIQTALAFAVEEVLETMCFTTVLSSAEGYAPPGPRSEAPAVAAELSFEGNLKDNPPGQFHVSLHRNVARMVAAGFLAREEAEVSEEQSEEVVCELANMICGFVLSHLESRSTFRISHPELASPEPGSVMENAGAGRWFDLGGGFLVASLRLQ